MHRGVLKFSSGRLRRCATTSAGACWPSRTVRSAGRDYPPDSVALLRVIKAAQRFGFTLAEVADRWRPDATTTAPGGVSATGCGGSTRGSPT